MRKVLVVIAALAIAAGFSGCATMSNDEAAKMVGFAVMGTANATGNGSYGLYWDMINQNENEGLSPESTITVTSNQDADGIWTYEFLGGFVTLKHREPRYSGDPDYWVNQIFGLQLGFTTNNVNFYSDINFRFLDKDKVIIHIVTNDYTPLATIATNFGGGAQIYGVITIGATSEGKEYSLSGKFGNSLSDPFTVHYYNMVGLVDGTATFNATTTDYDDVEIVIDFDNLTLSTNDYTVEYNQITFYPSGTVTGHVTYGNSTIEYTIVCNGTQYSTLTIGRTTYNIDMMSGNYTKIE